MDEDLSDDVKLIRFTILFAKRDFEAVLQAEREEVVNYATDGSGFAGRKVAEFMEHLERNGIPWPSAWKVRPSGEYPEVGQAIREIPEGDRKYVRVNYRVLSRQATPDAERDKKAADLLRKIRDTPA
jgi:hypothetical protein